MRAPGFDGAEAGYDGGAGLPDDHPLLVAIRNAPIAAEPMTEGERLALEELGRNPVGTPHDLVMAELAERAAREG